MEASDGRYLVGLIGAGIDGSLSPPLHEREADRLGLRYLYQLIDIAALGLSPADVGDLVAQAHRFGFRGLNITHPCKQEVVKHLDGLSEEAAELGAVNTVVFADGRAVGHNTDRVGFGEGFARGLPGAAVDRVVLIGAGGAGAAVASAMRRLGAGHLTIVDTDPERAERLAEAVAGRGMDAVPGTLDHLRSHLGEADGLINATPVGMTGHDGLPLDAGLLRPDLWVCDVVYVPLETELLRRARALGCRTLNGGGMVVHQAAEAIRLFTGRAPDVARMIDHFSELSRG